MYVRKRPLAGKLAAAEFQHELEEFHAQAFVMRQQLNIALASELSSMDRLHSFRNHIKLVPPND